VIDPNKLVAGMEEMLRRTLGPEIDLDLRLCSRDWSVTCDSSQLLNLAINARDAMPQGGVLTIAMADWTFTAQPSDPDMQRGEYVEIQVTDSGVGISHDLLKRVFEPFFTTKPTGQGTGFGLSQVYGFVEQSGGHVRIESAPGEGTRARIYLPGAMPLPCPAAQARRLSRNSILLARLMEEKPWSWRIRRRCAFKLSGPSLKWAAAQSKRAMGQKD
jgi:signal transduction histidine kinase